jgi:hypothetical protein
MSNTILFHIFNAVLLALAMIAGYELGLHEGGSSARRNNTLCVSPGSIETGLFTFDAHDERTGDVENCLSRLK